ncbi:hypothetical protein HDU99_008835 [Rhizoclosmatium hyalinum]|nr:hypothetical protein HDU99_008835 [Rhizoclosmatium hyalinum]
MPLQSKSSFLYETITCANAQRDQVERGVKRMATAGYATTSSSSSSSAPAPAQKTPIQSDDIAAQIRQVTERIKDLKTKKAPKETIDEQVALLKDLNQRKNAGTAIDDSKKFDLKTPKVCVVAVFCAFAFYLLLKLTMDSIASK